MRMRKSGVASMWRVFLVIGVVGVFGCSAPPCPQKADAPSDWCRTPADAVADAAAGPATVASANGVEAAGMDSPAESSQPGTSAPTTRSADGASTAIPGDAGMVSPASSGEMSAASGGAMSAPGSGSSASAPMMGSAACGNGVPEPGEACDGASCPTECPSADACTPTTLEGSVDDCTAHCSMTSVTECRSGDGCCPQGCKYPEDDDCPRSCGDGVVDPPEVCEPTSVDQPCPTSCDDGDPCTVDVSSGRAEDCNVKCTHMPVTAAIAGDECCPPGANANSDSDCSPVCGNGVKEDSETCDPSSACPRSCDDGDACTADTLMGSASQCNAACSNVPITRPRGGDGCCPNGANATTDSDCDPECGNGVQEDGEICDGRSCPTSCPDDGDPCTTDELVGSRARCDVRCEHTAVTRAVHGDGCCPAGVNPASDNDCERCGDKRWDMTSEDCDVDAPSSFPGGRRWDLFSCDSQCERRYTYTPCTSDAACGGGICVGNRDGSSVGCMTRCSGALSPLESCRDSSTANPGHCVGGTCWINCSSGTRCPPGSTCRESATANSSGTKPSLCTPN